tara:strand:- start:73 stop:567 length:495 start_codon:yes stop_codon:yes gene_type:complete
MKKIILLLLSSFFINSINAQTSLDYALYEKICEYRTQNNLPCWVWNSDVWLVANSHSLYQVEKGEMGHYESNLIRFRVGNRFTYHGIPWNYAAENCAVTDVSGLTTEEMATKILELWKASPGHNGLLLSTLPESGAVSCVKGSDYKWSHDHQWWAYATLNVCEQ